MALVILSAGTLAQSKVRTLSLRTTVGIVSVCLLAVGAGAFALGLGLGRQATPEPPPAMGLKFDQPEGRMLIDRVGELSGRLLRLENEALTLARRIDVVKEFEEAQNSRELPPPSAYEGAKPGTPAGGPLIPLTGARLGDVLEPAAAAPSSGFDDQGSGLSLLEQDLERMNATLAAISRAADERNLQLMTFPSRIPVPGALRNSSFGRRMDPFNRGAAFHSGLDFPAPTGTPIVASAGGRVIYSGYRNDYGYTVEIDHGNDLITRYAHCSRLLVKAGEVVTPGQRIGAVGTTGRSTGPHLHFEVLKGGRYSNPELYLASS